jgi:hypothetical protein
MFAVMSSVYLYNTNDPCVCGSNSAIQPSTSSQAHQGAPKALLLLEEAESDAEEEI